MPIVVRERQKSRSSLSLARECFPGVQHRKTTPSSSIVRAAQFPVELCAHCAHQFEPGPFLTTIIPAVFLFRLKGAKLKGSCYCDAQKGFLDAAPIHRFFFFLLSFCFSTKQAIAPPFSFCHSVVIFCEKQSTGKLPALKNLLLLLLPTIKF